MIAATGLKRAAVRISRGRILLEGPHLLDEALEASLVPEVAFVLDRESGSRAAGAGTRIFTVSERVMAKLSTTIHPRGPVAVLTAPPLSQRPTSSAVILWGIGDPGNLGTALRSCAAFGVSLVVGPGCVDLWNAKVLRAAAGAHFRGDIVVSPSLTIGQLHDWGFDVMAAVPNGGSALESLPSAAAVLIGAEGPGLDQAIIEAADSSVTLAMPGGMESLNAGVTASLFAYELSNAPRPAL